MSTQPCHCVLSQTQPFKTALFIHLFQSFTSVKPKSSSAHGDREKDRNDDPTTKSAKNVKKGPTSVSKKRLRAERDEKLKSKFLSRTTTSDNAKPISSIDDTEEVHKRQPDVPKAGPSVEVVDSEAKTRSNVTNSKKQLRARRADEIKSKLPSSSTSSEEKEKFKGGKLPMKRRKTSHDEKEKNKDTRGKSKSEKKESVVGNSGKASEISNTDYGPLPADENLFRGFAFLITKGKISGKTIFPLSFF